MSARRSGVWDPSSMRWRMRSVRLLIVSMKIDARLAAECEAIRKLLEARAGYWLSPRAVP